MSFDACFWRQESGIINDDMTKLEQLWYSYRQSNLRPPELASMFECVRAAQVRLRSKPESLLQHELALIDSRTHRRDYWAKPEPVRFQSTLPIDPWSLGASEQAAADLGISPGDAARLQRVASEQLLAAGEPLKRVPCLRASPAAAARQCGAASP